MKATTLLLLLALLALPCRAQEPCDADLERQAAKLKTTDRYQKRSSDQCEGVYNELVAGTAGDLWVASLTAGASMPARWPPSLGLRWKKYGDSEVRVQAFAVAPRKFFRLDKIHKGTAAFDWNTDFARKYLAPAEAGVVAWTIASVNGRKQQVYLPVSTGPAQGKRGYVLAVVPPVDLKEVYLTVASASPGAKPLKDRVPLRIGSYPANQKIDVDLPPFPAPGLYRVELTGNRRDKGSVTTPPFLIHHAE